MSPLSSILALLLACHLLGALACLFPSLLGLLGGLLGAVLHAVRGVLGALQQVGCGFPGPARTTRGSKSNQR
jgi:hypothetical protein